MSSYYYEHSLRQLSILAQGYNSGVNRSSPIADVPEGTLKVQLRAHQKTMLAAIAETEQSLIHGRRVGDQTLYSSYAILGDSVGVGKSLMIMGHIARVMRGQVPELKSSFHVSKTSSESLFSVRETHYTDLSEAGCLVVIPHTLYRQWADYVKKQSNLKAVFIDKNRAVGDDTSTFLQDVLAADIVLVSNTMYKAFSVWQKEKGVRWKRFFLDEADSIHIVSGYPFPQTRFTWYVSASWSNLLFPNMNIYMPNWVLENHVFGGSAQLKSLQPLLKSFRHNGSAYNYMHYSVRSLAYLRNMLNDTHSLRGHLVIKCTEEYIKESISLPPLIQRSILCKPSLTQQMVGDIVSADVQNLLHAGDVQGAIESLGVKVEDTTSIIEAVTRNLQKELRRHETTRVFKEALEYSTPQIKEAALKHLDEKIARVKAQIQSLQERINNYKDDVCPICYDDPQEALLTPCCSRIFCGQCMLTCISRTPACPMCRDPIHPSKLVRVVSQEEKNMIVPSHSAVKPEEGEIMKKPDALLELFKENPEGRFLVFSRYENPFMTIEVKVASLGITVKQLRGNKDQIASTLRQFQSGDIKCLLLNSNYAGAGLNITAATHVVLLHAMTLEEEKQILGRAYRMGRTGTLTYIKLLHPDEMTVQHSEEQDHTQS